ncbi:ATPAse AAA+ type core protein [Apiospora arundinis]
MKCNKLVLESLQKGYLLASYNGPVLGSNRNYSGTIVIDHRRGMSSMKLHPLLLHKVEDPSSRFIGYDMMRINETELDNSYDTGLTMGFPDSFGSNFNPDPRIPPSRPRIAPPQPDRLGIDFTRERSWHPDDAYYPKVKYRHEPNPLYEPYDGLTTGEISKPSLPSLTTSLSDHQLLLLRPSIYAFALKTKEWLVVHPERLREFTQSDEGIENLVLGEEEMKTIKGLSRRQNSKRETWAADFIEGKGRGQIILLHGPPGVGKTYTVEAIAQYLRRPLLTLTVTDIGTKETDVEHQLIKWFTLAEAWNAVLLVDEADIFLERRQNRDLARNGLVSAFLRRMEYFSGLLFLTTNRVGQIDDAFISRVHVAIGYDALTPEGRSKVWQGFFRKLARERAGKIQISSSAKKWVLEKAISGEAQLNGRDIRNALQTAITLAEAECEEDPEFEPDTMVIVVDQSHFQRVVEITNKFHSYVQSIRREDEKKRAAGRYDRNDYWKGEIRREEQKKSEP